MWINSARTCRKSAIGNGVHSPLALRGRKNPMRKNILVLNAGSSTLKYQLLNMSAGESESVLAEGLVEKTEGEGSLAEEAIRKCQHHGIDAIGFRVVHGWPAFVRPATITSEVIAAIQA